MRRLAAVDCRTLPSALLVALVGLGAVEETFGEELLDIVTTVV